MSCNFTVHANRDGLAILTEFPDSSQFLTIGIKSDEAQTEINLYLPLEQWWALRNALPKDEGYRYAWSEPQHGSTSDHVKADALALAYYQSQQPKAPPDRPSSAVDLAHSDDGLVFDQPVIADAPTDLDKYDIGPVAWTGFQDAEEKSHAE